MKNRKPKKYYKTWIVICRDSRGYWPEKCRAIFPETAKRDCYSSVNWMGGSVVAVITKDYRGI